jgi:hypothetical protein
MGRPIKTLPTYITSISTTAMNNFTNTVFSCSNTLKMKYITSNNTELSRYNSLIYITKDVCKPENS